MARSSQLALGGLLAAFLAVCGIVYFARQGRAREAELTITGQPRSSFALGGSSGGRPAVAGTRGKHASTGTLAPPDPPSELIVHVAGAVKKPGVYHFKPGARAEDAVKTAGGAKDDANLNGINLAAKL